MDADELEINFQSVYFADLNRAVVALNIIAFGIKEFRRTYIMENLDDFEKLSKNSGNPKMPTQEDINLFHGFVFNHLTDCIRISICFENFLKGMLLCNGYLIHRLDKNIYPILWKEQKSRPIMFSEIKAINDWEINPNIASSNEGLKFQIKGITRNTLSISNLIKEKYKEVYKIQNDFFDVCKPYFEYRNNLHYYVGEKFSIYSDSKADFDRIIKMVNVNMIRIHNNLIDIVEKGDEYKLTEF